MKSYAFLFGMAHQSLKDVVRVAKCVDGIEDPDTCTREFSCAACRGRRKLREIEAVEREEDAKAAAEMAATDAKWEAAKAAARLSAESKQEIDAVLVEVRS